MASLTVRRVNTTHPRSLSSSWTSVSDRDSSNRLIRTGRLSLTTHLREPTSIKASLNSLKLLMGSLISSLCLIQWLKAVLSPLISMWQRTHPTSARWQFWTSLTLCVTTTTTGMMRSRHQLLACSLIRLQVSDQKLARSHRMLTYISCLSTFDESKSPRD